MKQVKATMRVGTIYGQPTQESEVDVTEFASVEEAVKILGATIVLKHINYAQRLVELSIARRRFITLHEGPEKRRIKLRRDNT
jgi:hypothetical protein